MSSTSTTTTTTNNNNNNNNSNPPSATLDNGGFSIGVGGGNSRSRQRASNSNTRRSRAGGSGTSRRNNNNDNTYNNNGTQEADDDDEDEDQLLPFPSPFLQATMNAFSQQATTSEGISSLQSDNVVAQQQQRHQPASSILTPNNRGTVPNFFSNTINYDWSFNLRDSNDFVEDEEDEDEDSSGEKSDHGDDDEEEDEEENLDPQVNPFAVLGASEIDDEDDEIDEDDEDEDFYPDEDDEEEDEDYENLPGDISDVDDDGGHAEDVYYDSDGEDDEDDDFDMPPHEVLEFMMRNYMMGGDDDSDEDDEDDEDDDDESPCDCRVCTCRRFGLGFCIDDDNDDHFDDQNVQVSSSNRQEQSPQSKKKKKKNRKKKKTPGASCAICLEEEGPDRRFAFLPCCGSSTTEQTSSLRFCLKCLMKCLVKNGELIPQEGTVPPSTDRQMRMVSECPRCKRLLCLTATKKHDPDSKCNSHSSRNQQKKNKFNHKIEPATIQETMWYVGKQPNPYYMQVMLFIAYGLPQNVMYPLMKPMSADPDRLLRNLHQWGLISKQPGYNKSRWGGFIPSIRSGKATTSVDLSSYAIDQVSQLELRDGLIRHLKMPKESEEITSTYLQEDHIMGRDENTEKQCLMAGACSFNIGWWALRKWNVSLCILTWNRSLTLVLLGVGIFFPPINIWPAKYTRVCWQTMTTFNAFLLYLTCKALIHVVWIAVYLLQAYVLSQVVGGRFRKEPIAWKRRSQNAILSGFIIYASYRTIQSSFRLYKVVGNVVGPS